MEQPVCGNWHSKHETSVTFLNNTDQDAHITKYGNNEFPFKGSENITVLKRGANGPGKQIVELKDLPNNTYYYWVDICKTEGAPQNVTIP